MKIRRELLVLALLIAVLAVYLARRGTDRTHYELPELPAVAAPEITRIEIEGLGKRQALVRRDDRWFTAEKGHPADPGRMREMVEALAATRLTALVAESGELGRYDLDEARRLRVKAFAGERTVRDLEVGKPAPSFRHTFVRLPGDGRVYHATENFRFRLESALDEVRSRSVLAVRRGEIREILLEAGGQALTLAPAPPEREGAPAGWQSADGRPVKAAEVDLWLAEFVDLECQGFLDDRGKDDLGEPSFRVTFRTEGGERRLELFAPPRPGEPSPGRSSDSDFAFVLSADQEKRIRKSPSDLLAETSAEAKPAAQGAPGTRKGKAPAGGAQPPK